MFNKTKEKLPNIELEEYHDHDHFHPEIVVEGDKILLALEQSGDSFYVYYDAKPVFRLNDWAFNRCFKFFYSLRRPEDLNPNYVEVSEEELHKIVWDKNNYMLIGWDVPSGKFTHVDMGKRVEKELITHWMIIEFPELDQELLKLHTYEDDDDEYYEELEDNLDEVWL